MPRLKPTTKIDVIGNLDLSPEKAVGDLVESKLQNEFFVKPPNWDTAGDSIELMFIRNERENQAMRRLQGEMLANQKRQNAVNKMRIRRLNKTMANLRKRYIAVNEFLRDCNEKKIASEKKVSEETRKHEDLRQNIQKYQASIEELDAFRSELKQTVNEFEPYERVLEEVVEQSEMFDSVKDLIDRCDALMLAQVEIKNHQSEMMHEIEEARKHMVQVTNEAALTVLGLKNDLVELERSYSNQHTECLKWEKIHARAVDKLSENVLRKKLALEGVHHIYRILCKRRGLDPQVNIQNYEIQLDFIKDEVDMLKEVIKECKKHEQGDEEAPTQKQIVKC